MRPVVTLIVAVLFAFAVQAQEKRVSPQESRILLFAPYLEDASPVYQHLGWNAQASVETAYAGMARSNTPPSRAQVYLHQTAPLTYWRTGSALDQGWIRASFPFFRDKAVQVTAAAPLPGPFLRVARFERSEERRVGKECRAGGPAGYDKRKRK